MITKRFVKSSIIYTIAGALPMANAALLAPLYLYYLSVEEFGTVSLYVSFSLLIQVIVTYSLDASLYVYFHEYKNEPRKLAAFISSSFTLIIIIGTAVTGILWLTGGSFLFQHFLANKVDFYPYGLYSAIAAVFQAAFKVNNTLLQSREKPEMFLWSNILSFVLLLAATAAGLWLFPHTMAGPIGGRLVAFVLSGLWSVAMIYREFGAHFDFPLLRTTFAYNTYQYIYNLQQWVINYFDRILMVALTSLGDLGVYDFTIKCLMVLDFTIAGLNNSFFPKILSRVSGQKLEGTTVEINRYYHGLTGAIMLMVSGTILVVPILITLFVNIIVAKPVYLASAVFIPYASLVFLLRGMRYYFGMPYSTMKYSRPLPVIFLFVSAFKVGLSYVLIQQYGIYGAIVATLVSVGGEVVLLWAWMRTRFKYVFNPNKIIFGPLALVALVLILEPIVPVSMSWLTHMGYVLFTLVMLVWMYRNELKDMKFQNFFR